MNKLKFCSVFILLSTSILAFASTSYSNNFDLNIFFAIEIAEDGSANVYLNITSWSFMPFNITIPKTAKSLQYWGDINSSSFISREYEISDGCDCLQITPKTDVGEAFIHINYAWPDCAVPFNGIYYVGGNELVKLYPDQMRVDANVTIVFPRESDIINGLREAYIQKRTNENRTVISYQVHGYRNTECHEYLYGFSFVHPFYQSLTEVLETAHIQLYHHRDLAQWAYRTATFSESAYLMLKSCTGTRDAKDKLTIYFVPGSCIDIYAVAYYYPSEDAVYFPANWIFSLSYGRFSLRVLFHEIAHSFQPSIGLPKFFREGSADYLSYFILEALGMNDHARKFASDESYCRDPLSDPNFNASAYFEWEGDFQYCHSFYMIHALVNYTKPSIFRDFFTLCANDGVNFGNIKSQAERYDVFVYYLSQSAGKDLKSFFEEYGLPTSPERIFQQVLMNWVLVLVTVAVLIYALHRVIISFRKNVSLRAYRIVLTVYCLWLIISLLITSVALAYEHLVTEPFFQINQKALVFADILLIVMSFFNYLLRREVQR
jgi:hypothetical protein